MSNANVDAFGVIDEMLRAQAILSLFIGSLGEDRADDRYVLGTVEGILQEATRAVEKLPRGEAVSHE